MKKRHWKGKIYIQSLPRKAKKTMNSTKFKVEDISGNVMSKDYISTEQITKLKFFLAKMM